MDLRDELLGLVDRLTAGGIEYAVCGGLALAIHGYPRFTKDIDLLVRSEDVDSIVKAVAELGFVLDAGIMPFDVGSAHARQVRRISKVDGGDHLTLDLLIVSPALQDTWNGRRIYTWEGRRIHVVSREGLIQMKRMAGRDQDLLDARRLESDDDETQA